LADGRRTALLVEDETLVAMVAEDSLDVLGFDALCVETAADALAALAKTPDLALAIVDIGLPDMRGDALARRIRELSADLPIIMASGYDGVGLKTQFADDPKVAVLSKPYGEQDMARAIASLGL
jgi:CheY-like chemotaxis protein